MLQAITNSGCAGAVGTMNPDAAAGKPARPATGRSGHQDQVELSADAASALASRPALRSDLIERVRNSIESGTYLTGERIEGTVDRIIDEVLQH